MKLQSDCKKAWIRRRRVSSGSSLYALGTVVAIGSTRVNHRVIGKSRTGIRSVKMVCFQENIGWLPLNKWINCLCMNQWMNESMKCFIIMQLFCNKYFDWLERQILRTYNERYPVAKSRGPSHENMYPYVYIQIYFHSSDFARILTTVSNLKKINTFESRIST